MKVEGIDHVCIMVKDLDNAIQSFSKLFDMEFEELPGHTESRGVRVAISRPDALLELVSVVDPVKARTRYGTMEEGLIHVFFRVKDAEEAVADAKRKGVRVDRMTDTHQLLDFIPHFKQIYFNEEDMPYKWASAIWKETKGSS